MSGANRWKKNWAEKQEEARGKRMGGGRPRNAWPRSTLPLYWVSARNWWPGRSSSGVGSPATTTPRFFFVLLRLLYLPFLLFSFPFLKFLGITRWHNSRLYVTATSTLRMRRMFRHYVEKKATNPCEKRGSRAKCNGSVKRARRWHLLCGPAIIRCPFGQIGESDGEEQE